MWYILQTGGHDQWDQNQFIQCDDSLTSSGVQYLNISKTFKVRGSVFNE